jgi:hypothetical protein
MCTELSELRRSVSAWAASFDPLAVTPGQAARVVEMCASIEASVAAAKALAAARCAEGGSWQTLGYTSASDQLADLTGTTRSAAGRTIETGRRMTAQPEVAQAALSGELSPLQAAAVADGVAADPSSAGRLLERARHGSLAELHEEVTRTKAAVTDLEQSRRLIRSRRHLRRWTDSDGALQGRFYGLPEDGVNMWRALDPIRRRLVKLRAGQPSDPMPAVDYDALMILLSAAAGRPTELDLSELVDIGLFPGLQHLPAPAPPTPPVAPSDPADPAAGNATPPPRKAPKVARKLAGGAARVMVRVDLDSLLRGCTAQGETCEISGWGPVPVSVVEDLIATENPFIVGVLTRGRDVVGVYHHGRAPTVHQRSALDFLHPTCAVSGCSTRTGLQYDHREDWSRTHFTVFDLLDRLCWHHHNLKTRQGWALVEGRGKRDFVPRDDPRHPSKVRAGPAGPPVSPGPRRRGP